MDVTGVVTSTGKRDALLSGGLCRGESRLTSGGRLGPQWPTIPLLRGLYPPLLARGRRLPPAPLLEAQPPHWVLFPAMIPQRLQCLHAPACFGLLSGCSVHH